MTEDSALCLDKTLPQIKEKTKDLDRLFQRIDNLEAFVGEILVRKYLASYS